MPHKFFLWCLSGISSGQYCQISLPQSVDSRETVEKEDNHIWSVVYRREFKPSKNYEIRFKKKKKKKKHVTLFFSVL